MAFYVDENLSPSFAGVEGQNGMKVKGHQGANQTRRREREEETKSAGGEKCAVMNNKLKVSAFTS